MRCDGDASRLSSRMKHVSRARRPTAAFGGAIAVSGTLASEAISSS